MVPGSSSGFLTALVILMESCTVEGSLLQLVLLLWPKIDRVWGKVLKGSQKRKVASRLCGERLLLATLSNLSLGVGNEGLVAREDGAKLELVACVQLRTLLAKLECMLRAFQGSLLGEDLAAQGIFFFKEFQFE